MKQRCRCCLITNSNDYYDIFEQHVSGTSYAENICFLAEVQIDQDDGLPQVICSNCYNEVQRIYEFSLNVRLADERLRQELEGAKKQMVVEEEEEQMENVQVLENEYFSSVDENGMQVCVMEEILEQENEHDNELIVEEINDVDEIHMVEEILESKEQETVDEHEHTYQQKENLLVGLAQVAATQENVNITDSQCSPNDTFYPSDENDEDYLIEYEPNEENNFVPMKWKCGECKVILRGDVSYEGHMNIHRQIRPHKCNECQSEYRCRTALKRHKELKHSLPLKNDSAAKTTQLCPLCNKEFYAKIIFHLHQAIVHDEGDKCPLQCNRTDIGNLREHLESIHEKELNLAGYNEITHHILQCFRCCQTFEELAELESHANLCRNMQKSLHFQDENSMTENKNNMKIVKVEEYSDISVQCNICRKKLLKKNLNKHMELHKRKEEENKVLNDTKPYLCAFCLYAFETKDDFEEHCSTECKSILNNCPQSQEDFNLSIIHPQDNEISCFHSQENFEQPNKNSQDSEKNVDSQEKSKQSTKNSQNNKKNVHSQKNSNQPTKDSRDSGKNVHSQENLNQPTTHSQDSEKIVHSKKSNCICYECGNTFSGRVQLSAHKRLHKERPFKCDQCDKAYPRQVELVIHMRSHTGEQPYACHLCDKRFAIKVRLTYHLQKHQGITHACSYCSAVYDNRNKLKAHLFKHTGMPYKCEYCPELGFDRRIRFANHMIRVHQKFLTHEELADIFAKNTGKTVHFKNPVS
ncbi:zinc finger protein 761-like isoform X1 [Lucilia cuprina]|uniref:zinc finger protein 761-like isoform X1 n=1 Tax=Lucilia cuprina TaxID=7375 RepID=UPI001F059433|nr:zinc finger protein 761-like isoform X1 [Lucilia cuprina]